MVAGAAGASIMGAAAVVGSSTAVQAAKMTQRTVKYQDTPKVEQRCENCALFKAPASCENVDGMVVGQGWCILYRKRQT